MCVVAEMTPLETTITRENKTHADYGPQNPHRGASDIDMADQVIQRKSITVRWILGHRRLSDARNAQQHAEIMPNHEVGRPAKLATTPLLPLCSLTFPSSIWEAVKRPHPRRSGLLHCAATRPIRGFIRSHLYLCGHAAAMCGSSGYGATSASKGVPFLGRKRRSTVSFAIALTGAPHMPDSYTTPHSGVFL